MSEIRADKLHNASGDNDSGIDLSTNDKVAIKTADTTRVLVDASGNVGIGATTIDSDIHIEKSSDLQIKLERTGSGTSTISVPSSGQLEINNTSNASMNFSTNNSERMRIRSNGAITTGTSQPDLVSSAALAQTSYTSASNWAFLYNDLRTGAGTSTIGKFYRNGSEIGSISSETNSVAYNTSSDHRLKENVTADWDATTRLKQLNPVRFNFIGDADTTVDGFLAHEVQSVVPEAITGTHNEVDDDDNPVYQGIDQSKLVPLLVKTIQELEARITALENE